MKDTQEPGKAGTGKTNEEAGCSHPGLRSERSGQRSATGKEEEKMQDQEVVRKKINSTCWLMM